MSYEIHLSSCHSSGSELYYIKQALSQNQLSLFGDQKEKFAQNLKKLTESKYLALLNSGTSAIQLALLVLGVEEGDYVICSDLTYVASANPITYQDAQPIFIDSEWDTWNMDPNILEDTIKSLQSSGTERSRSSRVRAIIPVHLYGMPAHMDEINEIAARYEIPVIEDAAEALGSVYQGKPAGSLGDLGILSFNGNKIITTSGGGALLSDNQEYIEKAKFLATQARDEAPHYQHSEVGYNYRMGNINAAIGLGQMEVLAERVKRKREIWQYYYNELGDLFEFQSSSSEASAKEEIGKSAGEVSPLRGPGGSDGENKKSFSNRWLTTILTQSFDQREAIRLALEQENIESRPLWKPMHLQPVFKEALYFGGNVAEDMFNRGLCLPSGTAMTEEDLERIVTIIKNNY